MGSIMVDGGKVRCFMLDNFLSFRKLADRSGLTYKTALACGKPKAPVKMETLEKLCKALSCKPSDIVRAQW